MEKNGVSMEKVVPEKDGFRDIKLEYAVAPDTAPSISNGRAAEFRRDSVKLSGRIVDTGGIDPEVTVFWGRRDGGTSSDAWEEATSVGIRAEGDFSVPLSGLEEGTTYYYRCFARNSVGPSWASETGRFVPCATRNAIRVGDEWRYFKGHTAPDKIERDLMEVVPANMTDREEPLVQTVWDEAESLLGYRPPPYTDWGGATDAHWFRPMGIPMVTLGPTGAGAHAANEYTDVSSLGAIGEIYRRTLFRLLGVAEG